MQVEDYSELLQSLDAPTLLLGNGFSIACDSRYSYQALEKNVDLPPITKDLLERLGTVNIEQAMQILEDVRWVGRQIGHEESPDLEEAYGETRRAMAEAIAADHLRSPNEIDEVQRGRCEAAGNFLRAFSRVLTTNYDLLLYWILMKEMRSDEDRRRRLDGMIRAEGDGFGQFDAEKEINVLYLHGALHLYVHGDATRKLIRKKGQGLVEMIGDIFADGGEPLFVAAGRPEQKVSAIENNAYLSYCFDEFRKIEGDLVIYGLSLGDSDAHLVDAMAENTGLRRVCLGLYGDPNSASNLTLRAVARRLQDASLAPREKRGVAELDIRFFDSRSAAVWDPPAAPLEARDTGSPS